MNTLASLSNLFGGDMWILLLIVLILFGAKKLPELAKGAGQAIREFNKAKDEFEREITKPAEEVKVQQAQGSLPYAPPAQVPTSFPPYAPVQEGDPAPYTPAVQVSAPAPYTPPVQVSTPAPQPLPQVAQNAPAPAPENAHPTSVPQA